MGQIFKAKNPDAIFRKAAEARFFIVKMAESELAKDCEAFQYYLSAFLSAFRSIAYRIYGVAETQLGKARKEIYREQFDNQPDLTFLFGRRDEEIHGDGPVLSQQIEIFVADSFSAPFSMTGILGAGLDGGGTRVVIDGFRFDGDLRKLVERCRDGLQLLEEWVREMLASSA